MVWKLKGRTFSLLHVRNFSLFQMTRLVCIRITFPKSNIAPKNLMYSKWKNSFSRGWFFRFHAKLQGCMFSFISSKEVWRVGLLKVRKLNKFQSKPTPQKKTSSFKEETSLLSLCLVFKKNINYTDSAFLQRCGHHLGFCLNMSKPITVVAFLVPTQMDPASEISQRPWGPFRPGRLLVDGSFGLFGRIPYKAEISLWNETNHRGVGWWLWW